MQKIKNHFKKTDPVLYAAITPELVFELGRPYDHFTGLCRIIIGQQVSTKAAQSIFKKFCDLFSKKQPTPQKVLNVTEAKLRSAGLSASKAKSIKHLAEMVVNKQLPLADIEQHDNDRITELLIAVRGIGPWSAEMFLIFYLGREDIFSPGDLGLRTAIKKLYNKRELPSPEAAAKIARRWAPYRSYACLILWHSLDNNPS